ncbi:MAG: hypothetical protein E7487_08250 [Ruminococcaceae bacterium]|nr:hypothetical protein [Oscillospiraceae bacterium]
MNLKIYGYDNNPAVLFKRYAAAGITAVTGGADENAIAAAAETGLEYYICVGAFGTNDSTLLCRDAFDSPRRWFGSGCPNAPELREKLLEKARSAARTAGISGVTIDGARFASPASEDGIGAFFTCFCPHCVKKMSDMGLDVSAIRTSVAAAHHFIEDAAPFDLPAHIDNLKAWLQFRKSCVSESLRAFFSEIKAINPSLKTGIYIFTPLLSPFVGQSYEDISQMCDFLAPMIYRTYPHATGIACLDHELAAISRWFCGKTESDRQTLADLLSALFGSRFDALPSPEQLLAEGLPAETVIAEVRAAAQHTAADLVPIIILNDDELPSILSNLEPLCRQVDFYLYEPAPFKKHFPDSL